MKNDYQNYTIKLNIGAAVLYERMTGNSFIGFASVSSDDEDILKLMYCTIVANNPSVQMTFDAFKVLYGDKSFAKWMNDSFVRASQYNAQFAEDKFKSEDEVKEMSGKKKTFPTITSVISTLIVRYSLDPNYVMREMDFWEIETIMSAAEEMEKDNMLDKRFWAYLTIAPHIDHRKIRKPGDVVVFDWEKKELEAKELDKINRNYDKVKNMFGRSLDEIFKNDERPNE